MVFAVPDWEDGNNKKNNVFSKRPTGKQRNGSPKKLPQKKSPKKETKLNGVAEKSKLINKENKRQQKKKRIVTVETEVPKKGLLNVKNQKTGKVSNKVLKKKVKEKPINRKTKSDNSDSLKVDNLDTDKLDEVLLNAKKKKFNEALQRDDVEALLFKEEKSPVNKNPAKQNGVENNADMKKQLYTEKKQKKLKNGKIIKAKNNNNVIDKDVFKVKIADDGMKKMKPSGPVQMDKKKEKLKCMLKEVSNRNPINLNRNKLRERMLDRLKSAQFRFLNEKLYTSSGSEASELFQSDPAAFHNYHEGYQQQVKKWPVNPLDIIVKRIQKMPKSHVIADMGCGEAALSKRVPHTVRSFDLVATAPGVEVCDMAHTPLLAASMDAVVYCLALMGTELTKYLLEANRVLKTGGHLLIAEVESRFTDVNAFTKEVSRLGFKLQKLDNEREVFFFMEFVKNQDPPVKKSKLPVLTLKPCIYKRR